MIPEIDFFKDKPISTIRFNLVDREYFYQLTNEYPIIDETLDVIVDAQDELPDADFSFCKGKHVWIDADESNYRRACLLWKLLLKTENEPAVIFASTPKGLTVFQPAEHIRKEFTRG